jgi:[FeFe] hydrogenase H-cluster maturation GTPase HydF
MHRTPSSSRLQIAICGRRNVGKSSLLNALADQPVALVSAVPGTTTDPVQKAMELLPFGPVLLIDTAGVDDDSGELGKKRVQRTERVLRRADLAVLVVDATQGITHWERRLARAIESAKIPGLAVLNKIDLLADAAADRKATLQGLSSTLAALDELGLSSIAVSTVTRQGIKQFREKLVQLAPASFWEDRPLVGDLLQPGDQVLLIVHLDAAAPKGRLILPQVQLLRDLLDHGCSGIIARDSEAAVALANLERPPRLVVTDSSVFAQAAAIVPPHIQLTSFSILMARQKGDLATLAAGSRAVACLRPGDRVLIAEVCTHAVQHEDIGRVKIPAGLNKLAGGPLDFTFAAGADLPDDLSRFRLVVHCGGCMLNRRTMLARLDQAAQAGVPIVNYGVLLAYLQGILPRALQPFEL